MEEHHKQTIINVTRHFEHDPEVLAVLLGGSLAHGFATASSDVDIVIVVPDQSFQERSTCDRLLFFSRELCSYPGGYVDGKYHSRSYLDEVRLRGSEPARFAFQDAQLLLSRGGDWAELLRQIARYPREHKADRIRRFYAQFEAWHWYAQEAVRHENHYLLALSVTKLVLFGGRLILAHNEQLYPYHKWFLRVLAQVHDKPAGMLEQIEALCRQPTLEAVEVFFETITSFREWEATAGAWPGEFLRDSEWNWLNGQTPVDDL
jgi:hypothetical protein